MSHESDRQVFLRRELEHSHQLQQGKSYLVVKDPVTRRYFRFTENQAAIMAFFMEAPADIATVAAQASEKLGTQISPATIDAFCNSLDEKLLLETPEVREKLSAIRGQQFQGRNFLYWKIASVNPERIFTWLIPRTRWAYTSAFQIFALCAIFTGFVITYLNWGSLRGAAPGLFSIYGLLMIWPVVFMVTTIHEFSHGLTCCHYGGKVHEVGFMLIYFSPAFYCDVSDSYMFPKRTNRMAVALAGGFAQLTVWGICTMIWRVTDSDVFLNKLALIVVVFSGLQTLVNFNPLIKLDGYYMLSDFLEVPNLRAKALRSLWDWVAGNGKSSWSNREKRAQLVYGAASFVFSTSLLVYVYSALYTWATSKYALSGLIIFGIFANFTLRKALVEPVEGIKAVATRASVKRYRNLAIILVLAILTVVVHWPLKILTNFTINPKDESSVRAETGGQVFAVLVHESSEVKKGDVLARLTDFDKEKNAAEILGELRTKRREVEDLRNGTRPEQIHEQEQVIARKNVELQNVYKVQEQRALLDETLLGKRAELMQTQQTLTRRQSLLKQGLIPAEDEENARSAVKVADQAVRAAEAAIRSLNESVERDASRITEEIKEEKSRLEFLKAGSRPGQIQQTEEEVKKLESELELVTRELKKTDIVAKIDGAVRTEHPERKLGQHLDPGDELMKLVDISSVSVEMRVPEKEMEDVHLGNEVRITLRSYPNREFRGNLTYIALVADTYEGQQVVTVRAELANPERLLKPEMTGVAIIYCGDRRIIDIITRRMRRWFKTEFQPLLP